VIWLSDTPTSLDHGAIYLPIDGKLVREIPLPTGVS
jgi:hypothetical protein